jgi:hypothetical protein
MSSFPSQLRPTPLEIASGMILGIDSATPSLPPADGRPPLKALEDVLSRALQSSPCMVLFSGGRDSSCVLALAVRLAREQGLPLPVPVTYRFADAPEVDESYWQELMIRHLGIDDWIRLVFNDELDYVGPVAQRALHTIGLVWPPNGHMVLPALDLARGGTLVTGLDGDGLFYWRWLAAVNFLTRRSGLNRADLRTLPYYLAPVPLARAAGLVGRGSLVPWLRESAARELRKLWADHRAREPRTWEKRIRFYNTMRYLSMLRSSTSLLGRSCDVTVVNLFMDPQFISNLAAQAGRFGFTDRTTSMKQLFGGIAPTVVLERTDKPIFNVYWGAYSRTLAGEWAGEGVDASVVDTAALADDWASPHPSFRSVLMLQSGYLARQHLEEPAERER